MNSLQDLLDALSSYELQGWDGKSVELPDWLKEAPLSKHRITLNLYPEKTKDSRGPSLVDLDMTLRYTPPDEGENNHE